MDRSAAFEMQPAAHHDPLDGLGDVRVLKDDDGRFAAQLHGGGAHIFDRCLSDDRPRRHAARERHLGNLLARAA